MTAILEKVQPAIDQIKDSFMFLYSAAMVVGLFVLIIEAKLHFNLDIPYVDLPIDEYYQQLFR